MKSIFIACSGFLFIVTLSLSAQTTAFTYQGSLAENGSAANGNYDLRVSLYDAVTNGIVYGSPLTNSAVPVANGLFSIALDFGSAPFDGSGRWLEIAVRTNGSVGAFVTLNPR